jgi:hypothetical protein
VTGRVYPTIGVDPGERWVGLAVRIDGRCLDAVTLDRGPAPTKEQLASGGRYLGQEQAELADRLLSFVDALMVRHQAHAETAAAGWDVGAGTLPWRVAVEGIVVTGAYLKGRYHPGDRLAKLTSLVPLAVSLGVIVGQYPGPAATTATVMSSPASAPTPTCCAAAGRTISRRPSTRGGNGSTSGRRGRWRGRRSWPAP